jgi:hypothetical protein
MAEQEQAAPAAAVPAAKEKKPKAPAAEGEVCLFSLLCVCTPRFVRGDMVWSIASCARVHVAAVTASNEYRGSPCC